ncbi:hypothetical protein AMS68_000316 [Peltaster fructicola]|uniref:Uncharacterized protein n=1 Tax=Peltaster fructicola TaxID=286661 RepID=A0A6H0XJI4_9PEZI|nr:hypothetical protein AMS68_000316 [Peltaster fructicola]
MRVFSKVVIPVTVSLTTIPNVFALPIDVASSITPAVTADAAVTLTERSYRDVFGRVSKTNYNGGSFNAIQYAASLDRKLIRPVAVKDS